MTLIRRGGAESLQPLVEYDFSTNARLQLFGLYCQRRVLFFTMTVVMLSVISCCVSVSDLCDSADPVCKHAVKGGRVIGDARPRQSRRKTKTTKSQTATGRPTRSRRVELGSTGATGMTQLLPETGSKLETGSEDTLQFYSPSILHSVFSVTLCSTPVDFLTFLRPGAGRLTANDKLKSPVLMHNGLIN